MGFGEKGERPRGTKPNNPWINGSFDLISRRTVSEVSDGSRKPEETRMGKVTDVVPLSIVFDGIGCIASRPAKACGIAPKYKNNNISETNIITAGNNFISSCFRL